MNCIQSAYEEQAGLPVISDLYEPGYIVNEYLPAFGFQDAFFFELRQDPYGIFGSGPYQVGQILPAHVDDHGCAGLKIYFILFPQYHQLKRQALPD